MKQKILLTWLVIPLLFGCAGSKAARNDPELIEIKDISTYHVVDITGSEQYPLLDIMADGQTGKMDYLVVMVSPSGFDMDIRTAPFGSGQIILIPVQLAPVNVNDKQFELQVGTQDVDHSPHFSLPINSLPKNWRELVDQYWLPILEKRNDMVKK